MTSFPVHHKLLADLKNCTRSITQSIVKQFLIQEKLEEMGGTRISIDFISINTAG